MNRRFLNARHLLCPMPVIRVQDAVKTMASGDLLEVVCTDPGALHDIPTWCRINGHRVIGTDERNTEFTITLLVGG